MKQKSLNDMITSAGFNIVLMCTKAQGLIGQGGPIFLPKKCFCDGFLLMWCNFIKFEGVLLRSDFRHNDRVDSLWEWLSDIKIKLSGGLCSGPK